MYCEKCKMYYDAGKKFCVECGSPLVDELDIYAKQLLENDESAFDRIYNNTKKWVLNTVTQKLFNEQDRLDCTQEIYLKLFKKINLYNPQKGKFRPWFNTLVNNQITDFIRKSMSKPEFESDEEALNLITTPEELPEIIIENKECNRLLYDILDTLPEEQRICVERFYMEGKRRKEVAEMLEVSEETIKSRLRLARKKIVNKVLELEKAGTKIYGFSPFAFFLLLSAQKRTEEVDFDLLYSSIMKQKTILEQIASDVTLMNQVNKEQGNVVETVTNNKVIPSQVEVASGKTALATVGKTVATKTGKSIFHKVFVALITATVITGGGVALYKYQTKNADNDIVETNKQMEDNLHKEKELQSILDDIDMDYLESVMIIAPQFSNSNGINEDELYTIPFLSSIRKYTNTITGNNYGKMGDVISEKDIVKVEKSDSYHSGYILLKNNTFDDIFSILQQKFDITKCVDNEYIFNDNDQIKIEIDPETDLYEIVRATNIKPSIDSINNKIIIRYDSELSYYDSDEKYIDDSYVVVVAPADNKFGYVIESKEREEDYTNRLEEEKRESVSEKDLEKLADALNMNLLTVLISNYTDFDTETPMEDMLTNLAGSLYWSDNGSETDKKIYESIQSELSIEKNADGYDFAEMSDEMDRSNVVFNKKAVEVIGYILLNKKIDINQLWNDDETNIFHLRNTNKDKIAICMADSMDVSIESPLIKFSKKTINKENKQIELEYNMPFESESKTYDWKMKAIIVPSSSDVGYTIQSVESIGYLSENELKKIASDLNVPEQLDITFSQEYPSYWDAAGIYDFAVDVICEGEIIASTNIDLESGEMTRGTLMYEE